MWPLVTLPKFCTLWLGKATPRDWLAPGEAPLVAANLTTRYGRMTFSMGARIADDGAYTVHASVVLPRRLVSAADAPRGGIRLRMRAPVEHAGKLSGVTVGGETWAGFDAGEETVDVTATELGQGTVRAGLRSIVATFA